MVNVIIMQDFKWLSFWNKIKIMSIVESIKVSKENLPITNPIL